MCDCKSEKIVEERKKNEYKENQFFKTSRVNHVSRQVWKWERGSCLDLISLKFLFFHIVIHSYMVKHTANL